MRQAKQREEVTKLNPTFVVDNAESGEKTANEGLIGQDSKEVEAEPEV